jgi:uncharacterized protein YecA (UPF0149 family)
MLMLALIVPSQAAQETAKTASDFQSHIQSLETETQMQIAALETQISKADGQNREQTDRQIMEVKRQAEISRLNILLDWAHAEGDEARAAEIVQALSHWLNPPQTQQLPTVSRENVAPGTETVPQQNLKPGSSSK